MGYIVLDKEIYNNFMNSELIQYSSFNNKKLFIYKDFLLYLINDDTGYNDFLKHINKGDSTLKFVILNNAKYEGEISIDISSALHLLSNLSYSNQYRLNYLKQKCSVKTLIDKYKDSVYAKIVDGTIIEVKASLLLKLFLTSVSSNEENFKKIESKGITKREIFFLINEFIKDNGIMQRFIFEDKIVERYKKLSNYQIIDFESINRIKQGKLKDAYISEELKSYLYKDMPTHYDNLEKAIYLYIKMCKYLSYDPSYYIHEQKNGHVIAHDDASRLINIKDNNSNIVCYEFNYMYAKLLEELNIPYNSTIRKLDTGRGHANLEFVYGKYIVLIDAVTSIFRGDLVNAKINSDLEGIKCLNNSLSSVNMFEEILDKVYQDIMDEELNNNLSDREIYNLILIYRQLCDIRENDNVIEKKVEIILDELANANFKIMDNLGYLIRLRDVIFTKQESEKNFHLAIIKHNLNDSSVPVAIMTINENGINNGDNIYYYFKSGNEFKKINKDELEILLNNKTLEYINYSGIEIPGMRESVILNDRKVKNKK